MNDQPHDASSDHPFRWLPEYWELSRKRLRPQIRVLGLSLIVGVVAGIGAIAFYLACQVVSHFALDVAVGYHPHHPAGEPPLLPSSGAPFSPWMLLIVPTLGGIISGLIVFSLAPEAEGHGTDAAIAAFHHHRGYIRPRVPLIKLITSAITIGSGGSGGREGPIAQIGAGFGSFVSRAFRLRGSECRILMAAGMGAGVAAIFRAPLAGALFAAEVLYCSTDFESDAIVPSALASTAAYCTFGLAFGWSPLFALTPEIREVLVFNDPRHLVAYLLLAVLLVILAMIYTRTFYALTNLFRRLPLPRHIKPAIGAAASGAIGLGLFYASGQQTAVLSVLSFGYGTLQDALVVQEAGNSTLGLAVVLALVSVGKIATTGLTIGSGGSGGVFGPSMVIGGCGGGALGIVLHHFWPTLTPHPSSFVIVGMAGFFAAAAKTPVSTLVIVSEMTGSYDLLLPTLWVCAIAFVLSDQQSLYRSQVESRAVSPAHQGDYVREVLAGLRVNRFLESRRDVPTLRPGDRLAEVISRLGESSYHGLPVVDDAGSYVGMVSLNEVHVAMRSPDLGGWLVAEDLMRDDLTPLHADDPLDLALEIFTETDQSELPVVDRTARRNVIGIVRRSDLTSAYLERLHGDRTTSELTAPSDDG